ncbi:MAG: cellulase family glycosylhydrolase [Flavobacteriales bacterium]|jgi:hypothetical protein|nr:cellulase family glycosylhydrolase [Flavobacteriales bacterium]
MRHLRTLLIVMGLHVGGLCAGQYPGLVTLEGKQFKVDGSDLYPVVLNFSVSHLCGCDPTIGPPASPNGVYFSIDRDYGPSTGFDCVSEQSCDAQLLASLQQVVDLGFNTIRLVGVAPHYRHRYDLGPPQDPNNRSFSYTLMSQNGQRGWVDLDGAAFDGPQSNAYFDRIEHLLDLAGSIGLKVILLCVEKGPANEALGMYKMWPTYDEEASNHYRNYLAALSARLNGHPALLAYDLFNEPVWAEIHVDANMSKWKKVDICRFVTEWSEGIRQSDPDHLITIGGTGHEELENFDLSLLKIDFYSLHIYLFGSFDGSFDLERTKERYRGHMHWMSQQCPMPWIIGETSFSANDDMNDWPHTGPSAAQHQWPYMHGNEQQQAEFAQWSFDLTRQCGGSGWSWWAFQEVNWWNLSDIGQWNLTAGDMRELYYGMHYLGDGTANWLEKPVCDVVRALSPAPMPTSPGSEPLNYRNPYDLVPAVVSSGSLIDQYGLPIEHAKVRTVWANEINGQYTWTGQYTFTDHSGQFELYVQPVMQNTISTFIGAEASSVGGENLVWGYWGEFDPVPQGSTAIMERAAFEFDGVVANLNIPSTSATSSLLYQGWSALSVYNVNVQSTPDPGATHVEMTARDEVHITGEFHAQHGSSAHVYLSETSAPCTDPSFTALVPVTNSAETASAASTKKIELNFKTIDQPVVQVYPNPTDGLVTLTWSSNDRLDYSVVDPEGRTIMNGSSTEPPALLDLRDLADGAYLLSWRSAMQQGSRTVVLNRSR